MINIPFVNNINAEKIRGGNELKIIKITLALIVGVISVYGLITKDFSYVVQYHLYCLEFLLQL